MSQVNYIFTKESLTIACNGKHYVISKQDKPNEYSALLKAVKDGTLTQELVSETLDIIASLNNKLSGLFTINETGDVIDNEEKEVPKFLSNRIMEFHKEGLPFEHLLNFWNKVKANPSFRSREQLYGFLEKKGHPITSDGHFIAYRGVTNDFKDKHTGTFDNSVGSVCTMDRSQVDDDPSRTCSHGLHVAAYNYANGFGSKTIEVKVNPADVVAIPLDYNGEKMRVCKFEVVSVCEKECDESLYGVSRKIENNNDLDIDNDDNDLIETIEMYKIDGFNDDALVYRILADYPEYEFEYIQSLIGDYYG
jgi:hypothetical protein